jgi:hypothetical protein
MQRRRLWLFRVSAVLLPFVAIAVVEIVLRHFAGAGPDDPYLNVSPIATFSKFKGDDGEEYFQISQRLILNGNEIKIRVKKPSNTYRIFVLGESASAGWPHPPEETFSAYLEQALRREWPARGVEVINASAHGFAAYRIRYILREVVRMEPDAVLLWTGNNEFLEDRNYETTSSKVAALFNRLQTVRLLRSVRGRKRRTLLPADDLNRIAETFWKKRQREAVRLREDPDQFEKVKRHYAESVRAMAKEAADHDVPLILFTVPVNLRDWLPTVSHHALAGPELGKWQEFYDHARRQFARKMGFADGIAAMQKAIELDPGHAESHFWMGRLQEAAHLGSEALASYQRAVDLDYNPFRAISAFNGSVRDIVRTNKNTILLDMEAIFAAESDHCAPGFDLFLDYVHPTKRGNLIVARHAFELLCRILTGSPASTKFIAPPTKSGAQPYDEARDMLLLQRIFNMCALNHQYDRALHVLQMMSQCKLHQPIRGPEDPILRKIPVRFSRGYLAFTAFQDLQRRELLGEPVTEAERRLIQAMMDEYYATEFPYGEF